jgi:hypothetical protein
MTHSDGPQAPNQKCCNGPPGRDRMNSTRSSWDARCALVALHSEPDQRSMRAVHRSKWGFHTGGPRARHLQRA